MRALYTDFQTFRTDIEMLISETDDENDDGETHHTFDYVEGFVVLNNKDPKYNGWKIVPFSPDDINSSMIPEDAGPVMYCIEVTKTYNSSDDLPSLKEVGYFKDINIPLI
jgi:cytokinin dehydrogenase